MRVELEPLADTFIAQNIKGLNVTVLAWLHSCDKTLRKFTVWFFQGSLDEHHARVVFDHIVNLSESKLLFLLEQCLDVFMHFCHLFCELLRGNS